MTYEKKAQLQGKTIVAEPLSQGLRGIWHELDSLPQLSAGGMAGHIMLQAWRSVRGSPMVSAITLLTITVALFLLGAFIMLIQNLSTVIEASQKVNWLSIYIVDGAPPTVVRGIENELVSLPETEDVRFRSKEEALNLFRRSLGEHAELLEGLKERNPLPASLELRVKQEVDAVAAFERIQNQYSSHPHVELVQYDKGVLTQLGDVARLFHIFGVTGVLGMLVTTGFIIANTVSLALHLHRSEIEIMQLVGAAGGLVKAPFLVEGFVQGLIAGLLSVSMLYVVYQLLIRLIADSTLLSAVIGGVDFLSPYAAVLVVASGLGVGTFGAYLAVRRFIGA